MAVNIDDVYQKVLVLTNKEQRGHITPLEFNLLANKAQFDIYESYFHDLKTAYHKPKHNYVAADESDNIKAKLHPFIKDEEISINSDTTQENSHALPGDLHKIDVIRLKTPIGKPPDITYRTVILEEVDQKTAAYAEMHPLLKATKDRPVYSRIKSGWYAAPRIAFYPDPTLESATTQALYTYNASYWRRPNDPKWAYVIVNGKALYNQGLSVNFQLHASEEEPLVTRILQLAGVVIKSPQLVEAAMVDNANTKREQND